ncbi:MAG: MTH1187 family thiamine-binding protein [Deltaproteobacteria bacterium]|nr:MTH1187 family thiamine-binding protein [Deltaproteobacteria bacterium]
MRVLVDLTIVPIGVGVSLSKYVAACERVLMDAGLEIYLHGNGTNVQGEWDQVFAAIKDCHQVVHEMGAPRIFTTILCGTRIDREESLSDKIRSVEEKLSGYST